MSIKRMFLTKSPPPFRYTYTSNKSQGLKVGDLIKVNSGAGATRWERLKDLFRMVVLRRASSYDATMMVKSVSEDGVSHTVSVERVK